MTGELKELKELRSRTPLRVCTITFASASLGSRLSFV